MNKKKSKFYVLGFVVLLVLAAVVVWSLWIKSLNQSQTVETEEIVLEQVEEVLSTDTGEWTLVWNDEFSGTELDLTKWDYQIGNGTLYGVTDWGNNEKQYYTKENVTVSEGTLKIEAKLEEMEGKPYTSSRIRTLQDNTQDGLGKETLFSKKYGKFEARIKLPAGEGLWPAFWLLPDPNDNPYGGWASSGEIDIMEAKGRLLQESSGTIHYGQAWPDNKYSGGTNQMVEGQSIEEFHVYGIEWEPDEIRWYVDGELFHTENSWYARGKGKTENYPFPAPFNEEFYILLNLAVGGNFDNGKEPQESDLPAIMEVDYVRVYDLAEGYDETISKPNIALDEAGTKAFIQEDLEYNYISDMEFDTINEEMLTMRSMDVTSKDWYFLALTEYGGSALLQTGEEEGYAYASVHVINKGSQTYSVQLIQHLPLVKGYTYELSFDAKAEEERTLLSKLGGDDDNGWTAYAGQFEDTLTTEWQHYSQTFQMFSNTDGTARLEFNLGNENGEVKIANVMVKVIAE